MDQQERAEWFAAHISPYEPEMRRWLRKLVPTLHRDDVDDIVQEAYARVWASQDLSLIRNGRPFFFKVAHNILLERVRRARTFSVERIGKIDVMCILPIDPGPEREANAQQMLDLVWKAIEQLPARCRRVFELQRFEGLSYKEIAATMGIAEKTVQNQLAKALAYITEVAGSDAESVGEPEILFGIDENDTDDQ